MKKLFLKSFALVAMLLCGLTASAEGLWCEKRIGHFKADGSDGAAPESYVLLTVMNNGDGTITFTIANDPEKNEKDVDYIQITGYGTTGADVNSGAPMSQSVTCKLPDGITKLEKVEILWSYSGWNGRSMIQNVDIAVSDMCSGSGEEKETIEPTMTSASLVEESVTYNSVVINVAGTDQETVDGAEVAVTRFKVVYGETTNTYTATNGQITITGLTPGTAYSFNIYAVDAAGNESKEGLTVEATTSADAPIISGTCSGKRSDKSDGYDFTNPYNYTFTTSGYEDNASVLVEFTFNDTKVGVVAFLWMNHSGFKEVQMAYDGTTKKASYTIENLKKDDVIKVAVKFAYDGGMSVTSYIEYTVGTSCEAVVDKILPTMGEASVVSVSFNSAIISVSGTDKETEDGQEVAVTRFKVVYGKTEKIYTATDGKITITGLTAGTEYSFSIYAVDAAGNESTNKATVPDVKTLPYPAAPTAPAHAQDKVRSIYSDTYKSALAQDFAKNSWSGIQYEEIALDENNHYLFYTANVNWIAWGDESDGANAIIAAEGYNDGTHKGLDLSVMDYLHVDIFVDANCVSGVVFINNDRLAELGTLEGGKWNSLNLSLDGLKSALPAEKQDSKINSTRWIKFDGLNGVSMVIIDNVYAWKNGTSTAVDNAAISAKVAKTIENGQVVIIREGVKYNVVGAVIEK